MANRARALLSANVNAIVFGCGFVVFYVGVAAFSPGAANIAAGLLAMGIGAFPYLRRR